MDFKKLLLGTLAGGITFFFLGWIVYGIALSGFMEANSAAAAKVAKDPMEMWAMIVSNLAYGALLTYIFLQWANISTFATGAKAGAIIGLLAAIYIDFITYSMMDVSTMLGLIVDIIVFTVLSAIIGGVVGLVLGRVK